ncbi:MAG TPA: putative nucleotidyltransferase substrate binding domain-containing protein [Methylibium sp.]|nr:putative nucleotidyltransferase substrate binding domain-containing protein [Methylibium sp.]
MATGPLSADAPDDAQDVARRLEAARSVDALQAQAARVDPIVVRLHGAGEPVERIARLVSALNTRLLARLWALLAPPDLAAGSCLIVMGSEGRGEQILKTDQDNALLLRDGLAAPGLEALTQRFSAALAGFGYPPCPGGIMVTNPLWRQPLADFREAIRGWVYGHDREGPMRLAIFFDAAPVAGDAALLTEARDYLDRIFADQDIYLARFAAAADAFHEPGNWFTRLLTRRDEQPLDLKKLGTFPIVHGTRALSLQYGVREPGTAARLQALVARERLDAALARELAGALHFLMGLRLSHQLRQRAGGARPGNEVRPADLALREREPLREALAVVLRFRQFLRQHFRLGSI